MSWFPGQGIAQAFRSIGHGIMERRRERQGLRQGASSDAGVAEAAAANARAQALYEQTRAEQGAANSLLAQAAAGNVPSRAEAMLRTGNQQNLVDQIGLTAGARGGSLSGQMRAIGGMGAASAMGTNQAASALRAEELANARNALAANTNAMAGMDLQQLLQAQGMVNETALANRGMDINQLANNRQFGLQIGQGLGNMAGQLGSTAMMLSDERVKEIEAPDASEEALEAARAIGAKRWRYKDPEDGQPGPTLGFTAQDLEATPAGAQLVVDTPRGKAVSVPGVSQLALAAAAALARKVDKLEARTHG